MKNETYKKFNGIQFMIDEFSSNGLSKTDANRRKQMWMSNGYKVRMVKHTSGKYVIYREYPLK